MASVPVQPILVLIPGSRQTPDASHLAQRLGASFHVGPDCTDEAAVHSWFRELAVRLSAHSGPWVLVGYSQGADLLARHYYQFFGVRSPDAIVLLSPHASTIHLNNITCPYFIVHSEGEWAENEALRQKHESAILHHQYRYGDPTELVTLPVSPDLGGARLDRRVEEQVTGWLHRSLRVGRRPQERMPQKAAA